MLALLFIKRKQLDELLLSGVEPVKPHKKMFYYRRTAVNRTFTTEPETRLFRPLLPPRRSIESVSEPTLHLLCESRNIFTIKKRNTRQYCQNRTVSAVKHWNVISCAAPMGEGIHQAELAMKNS